MPAPSARTSPSTSTTGRRPPATSSPPTRPAPSPPHSSTTPTRSTRSTRSLPDARDHPRRRHLARRTPGGRGHLRPSPQEVPARARRHVRPRRRRPRRNAHGCARALVAEALPGVGDVARGGLRREGRRDHGGRPPAHGLAPLRQDRHGPRLGQPEGGLRRQARPPRRAAPGFADRFLTPSRKAPRATHVSSARGTGGLLPRNTRRGAAATIDKEWATTTWH